MLGLVTVIYLPIVVMIGVLGGVARVVDGFDIDGIVALLISNVVIEGAVIVGWYATVALYERAAGGNGLLRRLSDIFA